MKSTPPAWQPELDELLSQMCEGNIDEQRAARIEAIATADSAAMWYYLAYLDLHASLLWDTAVVPDVAADRVEEEVRTALAQVSVETSFAGRRTRRLVAVAGGLAALLAVAVLAIPDNAGRTPESVVQVPDSSQPSAISEDHAATPTVIPGRVARGPLRLHSDQTHADSLNEAIAATALPAASDGNVGPSVRPSDASPVATDDAIALINQHITTGWERAGISPSPAASDAAWLRRVYLDLVGYIPPVRFAEQFSADPSPRKREAIVERLLSDPDHSRHWATVWTNLLIGRVNNAVARRADLHDYLEEQFAANRPWSGVVGELLTATGSGTENKAANFLLAHLNSQAVPATAITARVFLGRNLMCVQCHNHPFNDWKQEQFWEFNSFFQQTLAAVDRPAGGDMRPVQRLEDRSVGGPTYFETRSGLMRVAYPKFAGRAVDPDPEVNRRQALAELVVEGDDVQLARAFVNRTWAQLLGYGFTSPVDDMGPHNPPSHPELLEELGDRFADENYDVRALIRWICLSRPYQLSSAGGEGNTIDQPELGDTPWFSRTYPKAMSAEQLYDSLQVAAAGLGRETVSWNALESERGAWLEQFFTAYETEENDESSTFHGTLTQALLMMNGPLTEAVAERAPEALLGDTARRKPGLDGAIARACLATLSREPTPRELAAIRRVYRDRGGHIAVAPGVVQDAVWAYMNSAEFLVVP